MIEVGDVERRHLGQGGGVAQAAGEVPSAGIVAHAPGSGRGMLAQQRIHDAEGTVNFFPALRHIACTRRGGRNSGDREGARFDVFREYFQESPGIWFVGRRNERWQ